MFYQLGKSQ